MYLSNHKFYIIMEKLSRVESELTEIRNKLEVIDNWAEQAASESALANIRLVGAGLGLLLKYPVFANVRKTSGGAVDQFADAIIKMEAERDKSA